MSAVLPSSENEGISCSIGSVCKVRLIGFPMIVLQMENWGSLTSSSGSLYMMNFSVLGFISVCTNVKLSSRYLPPSISILNMFDCVPSMAKVIFLMDIDMSFQFIVIVRVIIEDNGLCPLIIKFSRVVLTDGNDFCYNRDGAVHQTAIAVIEKVFQTYTIGIFEVDSLVTAAVLLGIDHKFEET